MENKILSLDPKDLTIPERHGYLLSAVAPRPIAFVSTIDKEGKVNLSPFSFFNVFSSNPPIMIFSPARSGRDNSVKHSLTNVQEVGECVISIVNYPMVEQMSLASSGYPKGVNEFEKAGFTERKADLIAPPLVAESPVNFECIVKEIIELGTEGAAGNLVICEVIKIHINKEYLDDKNQLDTEKLNLVGRMGGIWYNRASGDALFKIPKPLSTPGIGVDSLPEPVRFSKILSGNDLGRLGNFKKIPNTEDLEIFKSNKIFQSLQQFAGDDDHQKLVNGHNLIQELLLNDRLDEAILLAFAL